MRIIRTTGIRIASAGACPDFASSLARCRRGSMAVLAGLLLIPVVAAMGLAVDMTRLWLLQSRLQTAVDAAVLVAGRPTNMASATADATALFWSNFGRTDKATGTGYLGATSSDPIVQRLDAETVQMHATATLGMTLMKVAGQGSRTVHADASAKRAMYGMELALVLDVTGSMKDHDNIGGLRTAATNLIDIVFGPNETQPNLFVSVVPYAANVNIGKQRTSWLAPGVLDQSQYASVGWAGCIEARAGGGDETDTPPATAPFRPFLWLSTYERYFSNGNVVVGDNDWRPGKITEQDQASLPDNTAVGPNLSCPKTAIVPLTSSKTAVRTAVSGLQATFRGGTVGNIGLQAGWFTLSPSWSGLWGAAGSPLPYGTQNMQKVAVMMTDGNNEWFDWPGGAPGKAPSAYDGQKVDADYTAYGRLSENRLGIVMPNSGDLDADLTTANNRVKTEINARTARMCSQMKQSGITIYTVVLGALDTGTQTLWRTCASKPEYYFNSPDKAALASAFQQIGAQLASLRLTQ